MVFPFNFLSFSSQFLSYIRVVLALLLARGVQSYSTANNPARNNEYRNRNKTRKANGNIFIYKSDL